MSIVWRSGGSSVKSSLPLATGRRSNRRVRTVLVVEDERDLQELLRRYLEREGFSVLATGLGAEALAMLDDIDLMLLDLGLPDIDGFEVLQVAAREKPVIVVTARASTDDRIRGLADGADDYVTKPFSPSELMLRVRAVLGRGTRGAAASQHNYNSGRLVIDEMAREAFLDGTLLCLTVSEWDLLLSMASIPRRVFTRLELVHRIHGYDFDGYERSIDSHVKNLRHKLGEDGPEMIETVIGVGYRFGWCADGG